MATCRRQVYCCDNPASRSHDSTGNDQDLRRPGLKVSISSGISGRRALSDSDSIVGDVRRWPADDGPQIATQFATRVQETTKTLGNRCDSTRFGTEGSEVRILSPRPTSCFSLRKPPTLSPAGHWFLLRVSVLGTEWPVAQTPPAVGIIRDFSPPSIAIVPFPVILEANRYPVTLPRTPLEPISRWPPSPAGRNPRASVSVISTQS